MTSVCETFLKGNEVPLLPATYEWFGINRLSKGGGVGIICLRRLAARKLSIELDLRIECVGIQFVYNNKVVCFLSVYLPQKSFDEIHDCNILFGWVNKQNFDIVLMGGDFNAWCTAWGNVNNVRGTKLYDYISAHGFNVTKMPAPTRLGNKVQRDSYVDFFISPNLPMIENVRVGHRISDHCFCSCSVIFESKTSNRRRVPNFYKTYLLKNCELNNFFRQCNFSANFIDYALDQICDNVMRCIQEGWGRHGIFKHVNSKSKPWFAHSKKFCVKFYRRESRFWEGKVKFIRRNNCTHTYTRGRRYDLDECVLLRDEALAAYKVELSYATAEFDKYVSKLLQNNLHPTVKRLYKVNKKEIPVLKTVNSDKSFTLIASNSSEKATVFNRQFFDNTLIPSNFPIDTDYLDGVRKFLQPYLGNYSCLPAGGFVCEKNLGSELITRENFSDMVRQSKAVDSLFRLNFDLPQILDPCDSLFSRQEIFYTRRRLKKGIGTAVCNNDHIRKLDFGPIDTLFQYLYNFYFMRGYWPVSWRLVTVFPLIKGGNRNAWDPGDYRGISKAPTFGKFFEKLIYQRLHLECGDRIHDSQGGGRARNGAVQQIIRVVEEVQTQVFYSDCDSCPSNAVALALLDVSKAFDKFNRHILIKKLILLGVHGKLLMSVISYFHNRRQRVRVGDAFSDILVTNNGGPQGSVITLFCWLVYINDLATDAGSALFVDDVALWVSNPDATNLLAKLNSELTRVYNWAVLNSVVFDFKKFHIFDLGKQSLPSNSHNNVYFGPENPPWSSVAKYLGLVFDRKLSFIEMMTHVHSRLFETGRKRFFHHCGRASGANPKCLENIFKIWLLPVFDYASAIWIFRIKDLTCFHHSSPILNKYKDAFGKLNSFYMKCARNILGVPPGTGSMAVLVRLGWLPLDYYLALRACIWYLKVINGEAGLSVKKLAFDVYADDELWSNTCLFKPAFLFLTRLSKLSGINLFVLSPKDRVDEIKKAMFLELTAIWETTSISRFTFKIHPMWKKINLNRNMVSKLSTSYYHQYALNRADLNERLCKIKISDTPRCRNGCNKIETVDHILFKCKTYETIRNEIKALCVASNLKFNITTLLNNELLKQLVEKFLLLIHN